MDLSGLLLWTLLGIVGATAALSVSLELATGYSARTPVLDRPPATVLALLCGAALGAALGWVIGALRERARAV